MPIFEPHAFDPTAFMSGQVISKSWLCDELNVILARLFPKESPPDVWILGGWYAMTNFLLQARESHVRNVTSFDIDPEATHGALILNEAFEHLKTFRAITQDVFTLDYTAHGPVPKVVINTSAEHMSREWYDLIPEGTLVIVQSNDMPHDDHDHNHASTDELLKDFPLRLTLFAGDLPFDYGEWKFSRFMIIGIK